MRLLIKLAIPVLFFVFMGLQVLIVRGSPSMSTFAMTIDIALAFCFMVAGISAMVSKLQDKRTSSIMEEVAQETQRIHDSWPVPDHGVSTFPTEEEAMSQDVQVGVVDDGPTPMINLSISDRRFGGTMTLRMSNDAARKLVDRLNRAIVSSETMDWRNVPEP